MMIIPDDDLPISTITDVADLENQEFVENCQEKVQAVLMEYCVNFYPNVKDKFSQGNLFTKAAS